MLPEPSPALDAQLLDGREREIIASLSGLEAAIRSCVAEISLAFSGSEAEVEATNAASSLMDAVTGGMDVAQFEGLSMDLRARVRQTLGEMSTRADTIGSDLEGALAGLYEVESGLARILRSVQKLVRVGLVAQFLSNQALIEGAHMGGAIGKEFSTAAARITELAVSSKQLCEQIESHADRMNGKLRVLIALLQPALKDARSATSVGERDQDLLDSALGAYATLILRRLRRVEEIQAAVRDDVNQIFRGLQFEDISIQLIGAMRRRIEERDASEQSDGPVTQSSMEAGDVELF